MPPPPYFPLARARERPKKFKGVLNSLQRLNFPGPDEFL